MLSLLLLWQASAFGLLRAACEIAKAKAKAQAAVTARREVEAAGDVLRAGQAWDAAQEELRAAGRAARQAVRREVKRGGGSPGPKGWPLRPDLPSRLHPKHHRLPVQHGPRHVQH